MKIELTSIGYLISAAQALLLIVVLLRKPRLLISEQYLLATLSALLLTLLHYVLILNRLSLPFPIWPLAEFSAVAWLSVSPLLYLYCRSLVGGELNWHWQQLRYFPFGVYLLIQFALTLAGVRFGFAYLISDWNLYSNLWILTYLLNSLLFSWLSLRCLQQAALASKQRRQIRWLIRFFQAFTGLLMLLIGLLVYFLNAQRFVHEFEYLLLIAYAIFVLAVVFHSLRFSSYSQLVANVQYGPAQKAPDELSALFAQLERCMKTEQPYLQPKLSLSELAQQSAIPEHQLSQIFTRHLDSSFYQYLNQYRFRAFENQVQQPNAQQYTVMALAEASGFASRASFYKLFKESYGMTPAAYLKERGRKAAK